MGWKLPWSRRLSRQDSFEPSRRSRLPLSACAWRVADGDPEHTVSRIPESKASAAHPHNRTYKRFPPRVAINASPSDRVETSNRPEAHEALYRLSIEC